MARSIRTSYGFWPRFGGSGSPARAGRPTAAGTPRPVRFACLDPRPSRVKVLVELQLRQTATGLIPATVGQESVTFVRAIECLRAKRAGRLLAALLVVAASLAALPPSGSQNGTQTNRPSRSVSSVPAEPAADANGSALPAVPRPTPARRADLPAVFIRAVPVSVADLRSIERHVKALAARVSPAVVAVEIGAGSGSGVVISADGLVLTAGHVCGGPGRSVRFTFPDGKTARGKTLGVNRESDSGLMKITDRGPWPHAAMGDLQQAHNGDWVLALGHPGGFDLRRSLVVRLGRIIRVADDALQTDCTISPGDSGGPLFDMHGRIIGIHSAISRAVEENFHVAVSEFYNGWDVLATGASQDDRPRSLGAYVGAVGVDDEAGCRLTAVDENGPGSRAGLKVGDVVRRVDGREIRGAMSFQRWVAEAEPGETLTVEVKRADKVLSLEVKVEAPRRTRPGRSRQ